MSIFTITSGTKKLLTVLVVVSVLAIATAWIYYNNINEGEDPRVSQGKEMLALVDRLMSEQKYNEVLYELDTIETIFSKQTGYKDSYELGVIYNDRGSVFLSEALYSTNDSLLKLKLLETAEKNIIKAIDIYEEWIDKHKNLSESDIKKEVSKYINKSVRALNGKNLQKIFNKRVNDIELAMIETPRRLSVCYTNMGIIKRHQYEQEEAYKYYEQALKLWKNNHTAKNNLNTLLGLPQEDRSIIDKLFPKDRTKPDK